LITSGIAIRAVRPTGHRCYRGRRPIWLRA
jgi:hypothetical protein